MRSRALGASFLIGSALFLVFVLALPRTRPAAAADLVTWDQEGDFASLLARAHKAKKLVFVDFYATWCGPCKMMDREVYTDSGAAAAANRLVNRKIDAERGEGVALAGRYAIHYYPTLLVLDDTGKERARQTGYVPADRFTRFVDDARSGRGTAAEIAAKIAHGEDTVDNRIALANKALDTRDFATARAQVLAVAGRDTTAGHGRAAELWLALLRAESPAGEPAATIADAAAFRAGFAQHPGRFEALAIEANAHAARAEKDSAVALYRLVRDGQPDDATALAGFARFCAGQGTALDEALAAGRKAVSLTHEKDAVALDALADVYAARKEFDHAVDTAQRALDLDPGDGGRRGRLETFEEQAVQALHAPSTGGGR